MSSRLPTMRLSRSVSSSMVARNSLASCSRPGDVVLHERGTEALIEASGVRRSCETARRIAVRRRSPSAAVAAACAAARSSRCSRAAASWATKACSTRRSSLWSDGTVEHEHGAVPDLDRHVVLRSIGTELLRRWRRRCSHRRRARSTATVSRPNVERMLPTAASRAFSASTRLPATAAMASASARARVDVGGSAREPAHEQRHHDRDHEEHDQRHDVVGLGDRPRVDRRGEEPVDDERRGHSCHEGRPEAAHHGDARRRAAGRAACSEGRLRCCSTPSRNSVSSGMPRAHSSHPDGLAAVGKGGGSAATMAGGAVSPPAPVRSSPEMTWTSIGPALRTTRLITEPPASTSRHRDRLRGAQHAAGSRSRRRAKRTRLSAGSLPTTSW